MRANRSAKWLNRGLLTFYALGHRVYFIGIGCVPLDTKPMSEASRPQWITAESLFIPALYIISHFGKPLPAVPAPGPLSFLSPMFTSISTEMENVGNSLKCLSTKLALLKAKAICDVRVASGIASVFVAWLGAVSRWKKGRKGVGGSRKNWSN